MSVGESALTRPLGSAEPRGRAISAEEFAEIMHRHQGRIRRLLLSFVRDPEEAGNLLQECFLRAYQNWSSFRGECSVETWLTRIAVNLARDHAKNRRRSFWRSLLALSGGQEENSGIDAPSQEASPERSLAAQEQLRAVWHQVDRLPKQQRTVFLLRFVEEMSLAEISRVMELEVGTVKSHLARAVAAVRQQVKP